MGMSTLLMLELCKRLKPGARIASMGYPDIVAPTKEIESILGARFDKLKYRDDSDEIGKYHGVKHKIPDAHSFFELLGTTLHVYDVARHRGGEIVTDLNYDWGQHSSSEWFDFVIDIGTLEHVFSIGQAALNMAGLLKKDGIILHENPYNWGNHGFYNINPTWYVDFYGQEGFELIDLRMIVRNCKGDGLQVANVLKTGRFQYMKSEANMFAIAQRTKVLPIEFVVQHKYKKMIPSVVPAAVVTGAKEAA